MLIWLSHLTCFSHAWSWGFHQLAWQIQCGCCLYPIRSRPKGSSKSWQVYGCPTRLHALIQESLWWWLALARSCLWVVTLGSVVWDLMIDFLDTVPARFSDLLWFSDQKHGFLDNRYINSSLGLATYSGFSDLNRVDENWQQNPAGTVLWICILYFFLIF